MNKNNLKLFALGLIAIVTADSFAGISNTFNNRPWEFLEYKFISKPQEKVKKYQATLCGSSFLGFFSCIGLAKNIKIVRDANLEKLYGIGAAGFMASLIGGSILINYYKEHQLLYKAIQQLVANWPKYQPYTPEEFHETLNDLFSIHGQDPETLPKKKALKLAKIMREAVMNRNPKKYYGKVSKKRPRYHLRVH